MSNDKETKLIDTTDASVLEFTGNEAYGAIQTGVALGWNGTIHQLPRLAPLRATALTATPTDKLIVDTITVRGDKSILKDEFESPSGVWVGNYLSKSIAIRNADVQGMRTGISSPFFNANQKPEPGRGDGSMTIENGYFRDYVGVVVATAYRANSTNDKPSKVAHRPATPHSNRCPT